MNRLLAYAPHIPGLPRIAEDMLDMRARRTASPARRGRTAAQAGSNPALMIASNRCTASSEDSETAASNACRQ